MTASTIANLQNAGAILCFAVPCLELAFRQHTKWYKRITPLGWALLAVSIYIFFVNRAASAASSNEQKQAKHEADSTRKADKEEIINSVQDALKKRNLTYDTVTKTVYDTILSNVRNDEHPILDLYPETKNPNLLFKSTDKFTLQIKIKNLGLGIARNLQDKLYGFYINKENAIEPEEIAAKRFSSGNPNDILAVNEAVVYEEDAIINALKTDTAFFMFKIDYKNRLGIKQPSFRKIFYCTNEMVNQGLLEVNEKRYYDIKQLLIKQGLW